MPRKPGDKNIKNPLKEGMPSKIYLLAYGGNLHAYKIADILKYGWNPPENKKRANPSKIYEYIKKYETLFYKDENNRYEEDGRPRIPIKAYVDPLIKEMESTFNKGYKKMFTDEQRKKLYGFLDDDIFRFYVSDRIKKVDFKRNIDSFEYIMNVAVFIAKPVYFLKKQLERQKIFVDKKRNLLMSKKRFSNALRSIGSSEQILRNVMYEYLPSDIKDKYQRESIADDEFKYFSKLINKTIALDYDVLEILMKMPSTYETDTVMAASLAAMPELLLR